MHNQVRGLISKPHPWFPKDATPDIFILETTSDLLRTWLDYALQEFQGNRFGEPEPNLAFWTGLNIDRMALDQVVWTGRSPSVSFVTVHYVGYHPDNQEGPSQWYSACDPFGELRDVMRFRITPLNDSHVELRNISLPKPIVIPIYRTLISDIEKRWPGSRIEVSQAQYIYIEGEVSEADIDANWRCIPLHETVPTHPITKTESATELAQMQYRNVRKPSPKIADRNGDILKEADQGVPHKTIADKYSLSLHTIKGILADERKARRTRTKPID